MVEVTDELWGTNDLAIASFIATKFSVIATDWEGKVCYWMFEDCDEIHSMIDDFISQRARVNPQEYFQKQVMLKSMTYVRNSERRRAV